MTGHMLVEIAAVAGAIGSMAALLGLRPRRGRGVSVLIPFRCPDRDNPRVRNVEWLKRYWRAQLPGAEIVMGDDPETDLPFSKSVAVNNAAARARGDVFVIADADGYISADAVMRCVEEIREARRKGQRLWFVPYRLFFRMTEEASRLLLASDPKRPTAFSEPLAPEHVLGDTDPKVGHWYGAMIQIMPREAFETVGGWDERFRGWGGEDHAAMRAMDTLYGPHKTLPGQVLHVWHPQIGPKGTAAVVHWRERMWEGQDGTGANDKLSNRYYAAQGKPKVMRALLDEAKDPGAKAAWRAKGPSRRTSM